MPGIPTIFHTHAHTRTFEKKTSDENKNKNKISMPPWEHYPLPFTHLPTTKANDFQNVEYVNGPCIKSVPY